MIRPGVKDGPTRIKPLDDSVNDVRAGESLEF
jgi:hypothetical protein